MTSEKTKYADSFPKYLADKVETLDKYLGSNTYDAGKLMLKTSGEQIEIPYRIYVDPPNQLIQEKLAGTERTILACIMTRHHDGHVREKYLRQIVKSKEKWVIPFIIQLTGEYVIEILNVIYENLETLDKVTVKEFIVENADFFKRTKDRIRSYWNCYYWRPFTDFNDYVGQQIIKGLENRLE
jgi:hypothetical protein